MQQQTFYLLHNGSACLHCWMIFGNHQKEQMTPDLFVKLDHYISNLLAPEDGALQSTIQSLHTEGLPPISVSANQGKFLQLMMMLCGAGRVLEPGTLGGYSTICIARGLPRNGKIITVEVIHIIPGRQPVLSVLCSLYQVVVSTQENIKLASAFLL